SLENHRTSRFTGFNRDGFAVSQRDGHSGLRWVSQRRGVGDVSAFNDRVISSQSDGSGVDRVGDRGGRWRWIRRQVLEIATFSLGNRRVNGGTVVVYVVSWGLENDSPLGLARFDDNRLSIAQLHG
ncbi:hypothetical protein HX774_19020, partial [Brevundimonas sp. P7753]